MENEKLIATHRRMFRILQRLWVESHEGMTPGDFTARCRRLLVNPESPDSTDWIHAAMRVSKGDAYPRKDQVRPLASWAPRRTRGIHAALMEAVRLYGLGIGKRAVHSSFWSYCFTHSGRVPQELEHEETQQLIAMWVDAYATDPNHARLAAK